MKSCNGPHTRFCTHGETGKITHYETYRPQTNPRNPNPWESVRRYDVNGEHFNPVLKKYIQAPHMHDPYFPGGIRPVNPWELPMR